MDPPNCEVGRETPDIGGKAGQPGSEAGAQPVGVAIAELAARQHGVVSVAQLRELGLSYRAVEARSAAGSLHRLHRGVWPQHDLVAELDSYAFHRNRSDLKRDAAMQADLELAGYRVTRLNWDEVVVSRERTIRRLRRLLVSNAR